MEALPQNINELKSYILSFNEQESIQDSSDSNTQVNGLDYMSVDKSKLFTYITNIQDKIQPLKCKYTKLLSTLNCFEFDDNLPMEKKNIIFLNLRNEIVQVLKDINELNKKMAPLQPLMLKIMEDESVYTLKFVQPLSAIPLQPSTLVMPKTQQLKTPNYEITAKPIAVNGTAGKNISTSKSNNIKTPMSAIAQNSLNTNSGKRKSTPQSASPYINQYYSNNVHSNNTEGHGSNLKSLSPEELLKQTPYTNTQTHSTNIGAAPGMSYSSANNINVNNNTSNTNTRTNNETDTGLNSLNLNFDFDNFDDFLK
ncbi:uncharacterized protein HGUI_01728 [Hanseniaspora guilliermondii]|uniref:Uncharacterized protein n=1 Tax=Hanseniaspora guilliermondii TaxID=56406 RepID=A0A1L0AZI5_9ASCO|nr:uncharacterized protein HGUI_01728 [Hanseniaspora guilliermondii]